MTLFFLSIAKRGLVMSFTRISLMRNTIAKAMPKERSITP